MWIYLGRKREKRRKKGKVQTAGHCTKSNTKVVGLCPEPISPQSRRAGPCAFPQAARTGVWSGEMALPEQNRCNASLVRRSTVSLGGFTSVTCSPDIRVFGAAWLTLSGPFKNHSLCISINEQIIQILLFGGKVQSGLGYLILII